MTISAINLGNTFTNSNGTPVLSGVSSGINTQSVITSIVAAQSAQITPLQDQVTVNNSQLTALSSLQQILTQLQTAAAPLSNPQSPDTTNNLWAVNTTNITSNTSQDASNYITASVESGTAAGTYNISNITQLATATSQTTNTFSAANNNLTVADNATDAVAGQLSAGTITIYGPTNGPNNGLSGTSNNGVAVTLTSGQTLAQVAQDFNTVSSQTGIQATVVQTGTGVYTLQFTSTTTGTASRFDFTSSNTVANTTGTPLSQITFQAETSSNEGQNASFDLNGVTITRSTNNISDLISGVTLNLLQNTSAQANANFTITIAPDTTSIAQGISNFATAYNNFMTFYAQQTQLNSSGTPASSAILYSDSTLRTIYNTLSDEAASIVQGITGTNNPNTLAGVGLSFVNTPASGSTPEVDNTLSVDSAALQSALTTNFSGVENVFGAALTSPSTNLAMYQPPTQAGVTDFNLVVNTATSPTTYTATYYNSGKSGATTSVNLTAATLSSGGVSLTAPSGSALAGLILIYTGNGSDSPITNIALSQGVASQLNNAITAVLQSNTGVIAVDQQAIQTKTTTVQTQITNIQKQVTTTRQQLLSKFAALEAAITEANSTLNLLNAQQLSSSSSG